MCDKEFMWALKNGDLDEVKDYVAKVSRGCAGVAWPRSPRGAGSQAGRGDSWRPKGLELCGRSVPGNRCAATAAVAFLTARPPPRVTGALVVSVQETGYWNLPLNEAVLHLGLAGY